jgi:hypothetical protein
MGLACRKNSSQIEQLGDDLFGCNAERDVAVGGIGCVRGLKLEVRMDPVRG